MIHPGNHSIFKRLQSYWLGWAFFAIVFLGFSGTGHAVQTGDLTPDFTLKSLDGKEVTLGDYKGKYLFINFWATWCAPCKVEMPSMEELHQRFKNENFEILAISNDMFGAKVVRPYIEARKFTFTVLLDPVLTVSHQFGVVGLPATFLVDPEGKIIGVLQGAEDWSSPEMIVYFENLLRPEFGKPDSGKKGEQANPPAPSQQETGKNPPREK